MACADGAAIPIEQRSEREVLCFLAERAVAPEGVAADNPAFDVTPARLVRAIFTERGEVSPAGERALTAWRAQRARQSLRCRRRRRPAASRPSPRGSRSARPAASGTTALRETFRALDLHTVCEEARCPNVGECWSEGTATVMLLGDTCTRGCRFCAVTTGNPRGAVDVREPEHVARALSRMPLQYVVMTMVDRDDLLDGGASHVAKTVRRLKELRPDMLVETLLGDFGGHLDPVDTTVDARPDVWAHNIEVVRRLQRTIRDVRCSYEQSLRVLRRAKERVPGHGDEELHHARHRRDGRRGARGDARSARRGGRRGHAGPVPAARRRSTSRSNRFVEPERFDAFAPRGAGDGLRVRGARALWYEARTRQPRSSWRPPSARPAPGVTPRPSRSFRRPRSFASSH